MLYRYATVWHNSVIRGDINRVEVGYYTSIGENCVLLTAPALPTGESAHLFVGNNCIIGPNCTLYSCNIADDVVLGERCVVLEGAKIEMGA
jgi:carbonic anhydrase/acetyltransferase-like protein (isoleucine patch superfamily)